MHALIEFYLPTARGLLPLWRLLPRFGNENFRRPLISPGSPKVRRKSASVRILHGIGRAQHR